MKIHIGIFAHNEQKNVKNILSDIFSQTALDEFQYDVFLLANGCNDNTVTTAENFKLTLSSTHRNQLHILDLPFKGKSRCWNYFVNSIRNEHSDIVAFVDCDIRIPEKDHLARSIKLLYTKPELAVVNSKPVKDTTFYKKKLTFIEWLISKAGGTLTNYKSSICGQLYVVRAQALKDIYMPIGLPVEDGFLKAMIITQLLTEKEDFSLITGEEEIFHTYESISSLRELIKHQTRIVIGGAINEGVFRYLSDTKNYSQRSEILKNASQDDTWLQNLIRRQFPKWPYGYVSFNFLTKRVGHLETLPANAILKKLPILIAGLAFDLIVYVYASIKMARGYGANYW